MTAVDTISGQEMLQAIQEYVRYQHPHDWKRFWKILKRCDLHLDSDRHEDDWGLSRISYVLMLRVHSKFYVKGVEQEELKNLIQEAFEANQIVRAEDSVEILIKTKVGGDKTKFDRIDDLRGELGVARTALEQERAYSRSCDETIARLQEMSYKQQGEIDWLKASLEASNYRQEHSQDPASFPSQEEW
jgi:hypothetical protein